MRPPGFRPSALFLAVAAGALALAACTDSSTSPPTRGFAPLGPSFSVTPGTNSLTIVSDGSTQYCAAQQVNGDVTIPASPYGPFQGCSNAAPFSDLTAALDVYNPGWAMPFNGSHWIGITTKGGPSSDYRPNPGRYVFQETFNIPSNVTSPALDMNVKADNVSAVYLNGKLLGQQANTDCNPNLTCNWNPGAELHIVDNTAGDFNIGGSNTLTFLVTDVPTGFPITTGPTGGDPPQYACGTRPFQDHGTAGYSSTEIATSPDHVIAGGGAGTVMTNIGAANQAGCENPMGLDFAGTMSWTPIPDTPCPAGSFTPTIDATGLHIKYDQFPAPNDNSYGTNAVGWGSHGHKFSDLVGSDHAGFQLRDPGGTVRLSFDVDYISANSSAPSGYASLGVTGGDGKMLVGTSDGITATTSLANNLNNINIPGLFNAAHVQQFGSVDVLVNSPPTDAAHATYVISDPTLANWDFHDTYYVDISAAKLASIGFNAATWTVEPNASELHNSPAKACPATAGGIAATTYEVKDKQVKITISNTGTANVFLEALTLNWPAANGKLVQIKLDGDVEYNVATAAGPISLNTAQLPSDPNHRKIDHNSSDVYTLIFEKNADTNLGNYSGTVTFSGTTLTVLPH